MNSTRSFSRVRGQRPLFSIGALLFAGLFVAGCSGGGSSAEPPKTVTAEAGDGRTTVSWTGESGVEYWLFGGADPSISLDHWVGLTGSLVVQGVQSPHTVCGLSNDTAYYFILNGRRDGGKGGSASEVATATPRAAGANWLANAAAGSADLKGVAQRGGIACSSSPVTTGVNYVAVGAGGAVMSSPDALSWSAATKPAGFTTALNAVAASGGTSARWVAVGDEEAVLVSGDGTNWTQALAPTTGGRALHGVAFGAVFVAVGDGGLIMTSSDGNAWTTQTSGTTANLRAVAYSTAGRYVAVGDGGTLLVSTNNGASWTALESGTTNTLSSVAAGNYYVSSTSAGVTVNTLVYGAMAAGTGGVALTSADGGATFAAAASGAGADTNFVAVSFLSRFVLLDSTGRARASQDGNTWQGPFETKLSAPAAAVAADGRYVAVGAAGSNSVSF